MPRDQADQLGRNPLFIAAGSLGEIHLEHEGILYQGVPKVIIHLSGNFLSKPSIIFGNLHIKGNIKGIPWGILILWNVPDFGIFLELQMAITQGNKNTCKLGQLQQPRSKLTENGMFAILEFLSFAEHLGIFCKH